MREKLLSAGKKQEIPCSPKNKETHEIGKSPKNIQNIKITNIIQTNQYASPNNKQVQSTKNPGNNKVFVFEQNFVL